MSKNQNIADQDIEMLPALDLLDQMEQDSNAAHSNVDNNEEEEFEEEGVENEHPAAQRKPEPKQEAQDQQYSNEIAILAAQWKQDGRLPETFEVNDNLTEEALDKAVYDHKVKFLLDEKVKEHLSTHGLTEQEINVLRGKKLGVDPTLYTRAQAYDSLAKIEIQAEDENGDIRDDYEQEVTDFLTVYYKDIKYPEKKIEKIIREDLTSDDINEVIADAKKHFASKGKEVRKEISTKEELAIKEADEKRTKLIADQKQMIKSKKIAGHQFTDEEAAFLEKALWDKTEILTLKDGSSIKVSLYDKKLRESISDPEKAFLTKALFALQFFNGDTPTEAATKGVLAQLRNVVTKTNTNYKKSNAGADIEML